MLFHYQLDLYHKKSKSCLRWPTFGSYCVFCKEAYTSVDKGEV
ncbi:unnamed protein product [Brassica oleracea]